jgi:hypothetical protein
VRPHRSTRRAGRVLVVAGSAAVITALLAVALAGCGTVQPDPTAALARSAASEPLATEATTTTAAPSLDPGSLPQTLVRPSTADAAFGARVQALWAAVISGQPTDALAFFFPLSAYLQVKAVADPAADWRQRLVADYDQDIATLHNQLTGSAGSPTFVGIEVPASTAVLVRPGVEFNRLSYWRVYNSHIQYRVGGAVRSFVIASMISWRGEWYVVHLSSIR